MKPSSLTSERRESYKLAVSGIADETLVPVRAGHLRQLLAEDAEWMREAMSLVAEVWSDRVKKEVTLQLRTLADLDLVFDTIAKNVQNAPAAGASE